MFWEMMRWWDVCFLLFSFVFGVWNQHIHICLRKDMERFKTLPRCRVWCFKMTLAPQIWRWWIETHQFLRRLHFPFSPKSFGNHNPPCVASQSNKSHFCDRHFWYDPIWFDMSLDQGIYCKLIYLTIQEGPDFLGMRMPISSKWEGDTSRQLETAPYSFVGRHENAEKSRQTRLLPSFWGLCATKPTCY